MINFTLKHPRANLEMLGAIPMFLSADDPRPAAEQFNERYAHGGGWHTMTGWHLHANSIQYGADRPELLLAEAHLRDEIIRIYNHAWVAIIQPDGIFEISRMD